jgi:monoamine oxidase
MAYSRATNMMRRLFWAHVEADKRGIPVDEVLDLQRERTALERRHFAGDINRREVLRQAGLAGAAVAATAAAGPMAVRSALADEARVVIIGAGLAGVRCAHLLSKHAIEADIYEGSPFIGGRVFSDSFSFPGLVTERGGSFISTEHNRLRNLVNTLGFKLEALNGGALFEGEEIYRIDGEYYTLERATADWGDVWKIFKQELHDAPWPQTYDSFTPRGAVLDNMSIPEWFASEKFLNTPIGPDSNFAKLNYTNAMVEYGAEFNLQPALNLLYLLAWNPKNSLIPLPGTDEFYHVIGGNDQVIDKMVDELPGQIHNNKMLEAITGSDSLGPYTCHFADGTSVVADKLVLTLPFRLLREVSIDTAIWDGFSSPKREAIERMGMGTNGKIHFELAHRTWGPGYSREIEGVERVLNGVVYTDPNDFQLIWDDSVPSFGVEDRAILLYYPSGNLGTMLNGTDAMGPAHPDDVAAVLSQIETVFPGATAAFDINKNAIQSSWFHSPWQKGSYSYWPIGGYTSFVGAAELVEGNIHFAGEHTSVEFQGFMEGAVESGERAATEVFQSL